MPPGPKASLPIQLEGTTLEGGGQLLRIAIGLSSLTKMPIHITNIRGKRSGGGGLKTQHLTSVQWLGQACNARISGAGLKSKEITFTPSAAKEGIKDKLRAEEVRIKQTTPGSVNLVLQAILPYLIFSGAQSPVRLRITGGTNVSNSPSVDYIAQVLFPMLQLIGIPHIDTQTHSRGWSQGSTSIGSVTYTITPLTSRLPAFQLAHRGDIKDVAATILAPKDTEQAFQDELDVMFERRGPRLFGTGEVGGIDISFEDSRHDKRYYLLLVATMSTGIKLGRDWLYDRAVRPGKLEQIVSTIVKKVSDDLLTELEHGGCADEYLRDQLVVFQALAEGRSKVYGGRSGKGNELVEPSLHEKTAQWVVHEVLGVEFDDEGGCEGLGFEPKANVGETEALVRNMEKLIVDDK